MTDYRGFLDALKAEKSTRLTLDAYLPLFRATTPNYEQDGEAGAIMLKEALAQLLEAGEITYSKRQRRWDKIGRISVPFTIKITGSKESNPSRLPNEPQPQ